MNGRAQKYRFLPAIALCLLVLVVGGGGFWLIRSFLSGEAPPQKKVVQEIRIIRPPPEELPPPPPPPPPEEEVDVPEPEQQPDPVQSDEPPPMESLGLDADGSAGSDGFGLAARKGGRDLLASGGSAFKWYAGQLQNQILDWLQDEKSAREGAYTATVKVWVTEDGTISRVSVTQSSGNKDRDRAIETRLGQMPRMQQRPPADMPQPVTLRISSRA